MPFSISSLASWIDFFERSACDQVWLPLACTPAATCLRIPGSHIACLPIGKKIALVHCSARAASTAGVRPGHGPSSKVNTTSPGRRKSWLLKCSKPKPGPPVVSTSTMRATPRALGLLQDETGAGAKAAGPGSERDGAAAGVGACATTAGGGVVFCGAGAAAAGSSLTGRLSAEAWATVDKVVGSDTVVVLAAGAAESTTVADCHWIAPKTAKNATTTNAIAPAARRMAFPQTLRRHRPRNFNGAS